MPTTSAPVSVRRSASVDPMNPATPVTSAFMRTASRTRSGSRHGLPDASSEACTVRPVASDRPSVDSHDLVFELHPHRRHQRAPVRISSSSSYRAGWRYSQWASMTGQREAVGFHLAIAPARRRAADRCGRPRTRRSSWRSRRRPSGRFRRTARGRARRIGGALMPVAEARAPGRLGAAAAPPP